ncbi:MAG: peptidylprolyl isomerase [Candidatus Riflebacteria bacterium]|nr:peptidylprolyl isomerase [Candidatus Riflebacteria bacterium]
MATPRSLAGEVRLGARALAERVRNAAHDPARVWLMRPVLAQLFAHRLPPGPVRGQDDERLSPGKIASDVQGAETRAVGDLEAVGEPLLTFFFLRVGDARAETAARCVLIRLLALRWPDRLAPELARMLREAPPSVPLWEAAAAAGRIDRRLEAPGLKPDLRRAVSRLAGWGRQYPIQALVAAGDRDSIAEVLPALADPEPAVRRHAALYLGQCETKAMLEPLSRLARRDSDGKTREAAQVALARLLGVVTPRFVATPRDIDEAYDRFLKAGRRESVRMRQLFVARGLPHEAAARERLEALRRRIGAGESFERLAAAFSADRAPLTRGGLLSPPLPPSRLAPELACAVERLVPGEVSMPVETRAGFHLVQLVQRLSPEAVPLTDVVDRLRSQVEETKRLELLDRALLPQLAMFRTRARGL